MTEQDIEELRNPCIQALAEMNEDFKDMIIPYITLLERELAKEHTPDDSLTIQEYFEEEISDIWAEIFYKQPLSA